MAAGDIIQTNSGSSGGAASGTSFNVTVPTATSGKELTLFVIHSGATAPASSGWSQIGGPVTVGSTGPAYLRAYRRTGSSGQTSWTFSIDNGNAYSWLVLEHDTNGVDGTVPTGTTANSGTTLASPSKTTSTANVLLLAVHAGYAFFGAPGTWSGHTNSFTEQREQAPTTNTQLDVGLSASARKVTATGTYSTTATCSVGFSGTSDMGASLLIPLTYSAGGGSTNHDLAGTVAATGGTSASVGVSRPVAGAVAAVAATVAALTVSHPLTGAVDAVTGSAATATASRPLAGAAAAASDTSAALTVQRPLAGTVAATAGASGALDATRPLSGTVDATSAASGALSGARPLAGAVAATSGTSAAFDTPGPTDHVLAGTVTATTATTGALTASRPLAGPAAAATSTVAASLTAGRPLAGTVPAVSGTTAAPLTVTRVLSGAVDATSDATGLVAVSRPLTGTVEAVSATSAAMTGSDDGVPVPFGRLTLTIPDSTLAVTIPAATLELSIPAATMEVRMTLHVGDTQPPFTARLTSDRAGVNLTGATIALHLKKPDKSVVDLAATGAADGVLTAEDWPDGMLDQSGNWNVEAQVTYSGGAVQTFGPNEFYVAPQIA